jgi:hypothetical protein
MAFSVDPSQWYASNAGTRAHGRDPRDILIFYNRAAVVGRTRQEAERSIGNITNTPASSRTRGGRDTVETVAHDPKRDRLAVDKARKSGSQPTHRWRERDSNPRSLSRQCHFILSEEKGPQDDQGV